MTATPRPARRKAEAIPPPRIVSTELVATAVTMAMDAARTGDLKPLEGLAAYLSGVSPAALRLH